MNYKLPRRAARPSLALLLFSSFFFFWLVLLLLVPLNEGGFCFSVIERFSILTLQVMKLTRITLVMKCENSNSDDNNNKNTRQKNYKFHLHQDRSARN
jgi:hypothetical protein